MRHSASVEEWVTALAIAAGGVLVALVLRLVLGRVTRRSTSSGSTGVDVAGFLLRGLVPPGVVIVAFWVALAQLPLRARPRSVTDHVLVAAAILVITLVLARLAVVATRSFATRRAGVAPSTAIFANVVRIAVLAVGLLVLLETLGVSIAPLLTALGVGGLAVALALQDTLTNLFAGIHILASKKIEPGNYVRLASGEEGYVVDVNWRSTTIRALPNNMVVVPNSQLASGILTNFHQPEQEMSVLVQVGVSYDSDLEKVERVTIEVGREVMHEVEGAIRTHEPTIRYHTFDQSSIDFSVILRAREYTDQYLITHEFIKRLQPRYRAEGIEIPFPIRTIVLPQDANATALNGHKGDGQEREGLAANGHGPGSPEPAGEH